MAPQMRTLSGTVLTIECHDLYQTSETLLGRHTGGRHGHNPLSSVVTR